MLCISWFLDKCLSNPYCLVWPPVPPGKAGGSYVMCRIFIWYWPIK